MKINKYPDKTSYAVLEEKYKISYRFSYKINSYEDLWHLNQIVDVYNHNGCTPIITIPNLIDAQADRRFNYNESNGLKLVCKFLNSMDAKFKIFHPHNPEVVEALINNVEIINNSTFIKVVLTKLSTDNNYVSLPGFNLKKNFIENTILMSSDAGGFKPLIKLCDKIGWQGETFSASKSRKYIDGKSKLHQQIDKEDFEGKDILIVDDISVYGGTFKGLSKLLKERNCGKLYLAVSHMTIQNLGQDPVTNYFDKVFTTNSKFDNYKYEQEDSVWDDFDMLPEPKNLIINKTFKV